MSGLRTERAFQQDYARRVGSNGLYAVSRGTRRTHVTAGVYLRDR